MPANHTPYRAPKAPEDFEALANRELEATGLDPSRFQKTPGELRKSKIRRAIVMGTSAMIVLLCFIVANLTSNSSVTKQQLFNGSGSTATWSFTKKLTEEERLILLGAPNKSNRIEKWKPLFKLDSTHPPYFIPYAKEYLDEYGEFPMEINKARSNYDPNNSWYELMLAAKLNDGNIERTACNTNATRAPNYIFSSNPSKYEVKGEEKLKQAERLVKLAYEKGGYDNYARDAWQEKRTILGEPTSFAEQVSFLGFAASEITYGVTETLKLVELFTVLIARAKENNDWEALKEYHRITLWHNEAISKNSLSLVDGLVNLALWRSYSVAFYDAVHECPDTEFKELIYAQYARTKDYAEQKKNRPNDESHDRIIAKYGSYLSNISFPAIHSATLGKVNLDSSELRPDTRVEKAFVARVAFLKILLITVFAAIFATAYTLPLSSITKHNIQTLSPSIKPLWWMIPLCVILPTILFILLRNIIGVEALDRGPALNPLFSHIINPYCYLFFLISSMIQFSLRKITPIPLKKKWHIASIVMSFIGLSTAHLATDLGFMSWFNSTLLVLTILLNTTLAIKPLTTKRGRLHCGIMMKLELPCIAASAVIFLVLMLASQQLEQYWLTHNSLLTPSSTGLSKIEARVQKQLNKEVRELAMLPPLED